MSLCYTATVTYGFSYCDTAKEPHVSKGNRAGLLSMILLPDTKRSDGYKAIYHVRSKGRVNGNKLCKSTECHKQAGALRNDKENDGQSLSTKGGLVILRTPLALVIIRKIVLLHRRQYRAGNGPNCGQQRSCDATALCPVYAFVYSR
jgi:hypothetical protein